MDEARMKQWAVVGLGAAVQRHPALFEAGTSPARTLLEASSDAAHPLAPPHRRQTLRSRGSGARWLRELEHVRGAEDRGELIGIAREELVSAVARQRHLDVASSESRCCEVPECALRR